MQTVSVYYCIRRVYHFNTCNKFGNKKKIRIFFYENKKSQTTGTLCLHRTSPTYAKLSVEKYDFMKRSLTNTRPAYSETFCSTIYNVSNRSREIILYCRDEMIMRIFTHRAIFNNRQIFIFININIYKCIVKRRIQFCINYYYYC